MGETRVCIDATPLLLRSAGVKTYVYYWTEALRLEGGANSIELFPMLAPPGEVVHEQSVLNRPATMARLAWLHLANTLPVPLLNGVGAGVSVFHASHQLLRPPTNTRVTATIYDMTCWLVPQFHSPANVRMAKKFAASVMRRADGLIAISESTKNDAVRILKLDPRRVTVIYPGVAESFFCAQPLQRAKPYILFVGTIEPRKNVATLLDAYERLRPELREAFDLVLAGSPGWGDPSVLARIRQGIRGVDYLGYVPEERLPALTAGASVFVYPSVYEGFGLPVAQAMAAGIPVVTSAVSSLPEIAGAGAVAVDPGSPAELASAMAQLLESDSLRESLGANGRSIAQQYRWDCCARKSWELFRSLV
jgi:glycosyltransferase involved in cell wall biosynthesis